MNLRTKPRPELVLIAKSAANAIAAGKVTGFTPEQNIALSTALLNKAESLDMMNKKAVVSRSAAQADTARAQGEWVELLELMGTTKYAMRGAGPSPDQYEAVGFKPPASASRVTPETPSELSAVGQSNGVNKLKLKGNNEPGSVIYVFEANGGDGWFIIGTTGKRSFVHNNVKPGDAYAYRVRAQASSGQTSTWSNTASVYGPIKKVS